MPDIRTGGAPESGSPSAMLEPRRPRMREVKLAAILVMHCLRLRFQGLGLRGGDIRAGGHISTASGFALPSYDVKSLIPWETINPKP